MIVFEGVEYPNYKFDFEKNEVFSLIHKKYKKPILKYDGYYDICLCKNHKQKNIRFHRLVYQMHNPDIDLKGKDIDHINQIRTDNRIENLRIATKSENCQNRIYKNSRSKYSGVSKSANKWRAVINVNGKNEPIGYFENELDAAKTHDKYIFQNGLDNGFRQLNCRLFPDEICEGELWKKILE